MAIHQRTLKLLKMLKIKKKSDEFFAEENADLSPEESINVSRHCFYQRECKEEFGRTPSSNQRCLDMSIELSGTSSKQSWIGVSQNGEGDRFDQRSATPT